MPALRLVLWIIALPFTAFSLWVLSQVGYLGIWQGGLASLGSMQVTLDLVVACTLLTGFIARDCRAQGRPWWPWALLTAVAGSLGPLAYLLWPRR